MPPFKDRADRLDLSFPLEFTLDGEVTAGLCLNLSASGLLGNFSRPLELWTTGDLLLHFGASAHRLGARVARTEGSEAGLAFLFGSEADREAIQGILAFAAGRTHLLDHIPF